MLIAVLGIDLGKNSCSVVGLDPTGCVVLRRRLSREGVVKLAAGLPACVAAMEACCGAHHLGHLLRDLGHEVRLMSPEYVRPYVKAQKNDDRDAEAIAEAATRPTMRFVELKTAEQLDMQSLHRVRDRLVGERTALLNQLRAILLERGITVPQGRHKLQQAVTELLEPSGKEGGEPALSPRIRQLVQDMRSEWLALDRRIGGYDDEFAVRARADEAKAPGNNPWHRRAERDRPGRYDWERRGLCARARLGGLAGPGAAPGGKPRLLGITKRGNKYLRKLLIHGARAAMPSLMASATPLGSWLRGLVARVHRNAATVALANKLARIAWAVLRRGERFDASRAVAA